MTEADKLRVHVITPGRQVFEGTAVSVQFPGSDGLYGVLPGHAPLITTVEPGILTMRADDGPDHELVVSRGFAQVVDNEVRLAVDSGESVEEINVERAQLAADRARERIQESRVKEIDLVRAHYALRRALTRLRARGQRT